MTTWTNFAAATGAATNTWNYHATRGWLESKRYQDGLGPDYTYTPGGRLKTRSWVRTVAGGARLLTTYKYGFDDTPSTNQHPDVVEVSYNDGSPTLSTGYDRLGRARSVSDGTQTLTRFRTDSGLLLGESWSGGLLSGFNVTNTYDALERRRSLAARNGATVLGEASGHDDIGNRRTAAEGGDVSSSVPNLLNQWTSRTNAPGLELHGMASVGAEVRVNGVPATRALGNLSAVPGRLTALITIATVSEP